MVFDFIRANRFALIGITGRAGAGKTRLCQELKNRDDSFFVYSADWKFIGDSEYRKTLLQAKSHGTTSAYIDACNQSNWWNWDDIYSDLRTLKMGGDVIVPNAYDRDTGKNLDVTLSGKHGTVLYEGAILGTMEILNLLDCIIFLDEKDSVRFLRLYRKDRKRRSCKEIAARFLITEYSEDQHYNILNKYFGYKVSVYSENKLKYNKIPVGDSNYVPLLLS